MRNLIFLCPELDNRETLPCQLVMIPSCSPTLFNLGGDRCGRSYCLFGSKSGLAGMTRSLAAELGGAGITVKYNCSWFFVTDMTKNLRENDEFNRLVSETPVGRVGVPCELAGPLLLASDAGSYINGHTLTVDGGLTTTFPSKIWGRKSTKILHRWFEIVLRLKANRPKAMSDCTEYAPASVN